MTFSILYFYKILFILICLSKKSEFSELPSFSNFSKEPNLRIVNGQVANIKDFPYQVYVFAALRRVCNKQGCGYLGVSCGGFIANKRNIVLAAHCLIDEQGKIANAQQIEVHVGLSKASDKDEKKVYQAAELYVHPNYNEQSFKNDIAIIKLKNSISFNNMVKPACLDLTKKQYPFLIGTGYGSVTTKLQRGNQVIQSPQPGDQLKFAYFRENRKIGPKCKSDGFICVEPYHSGSGDSICMGDSGGPITTSSYEVKGVASNVQGVYIGNNVIEYCNGLAKYTRLSAHIGFLDKYIGKENYCWTRNS